jgi:FkbM family methyltransferase
MLSKCYCFEPNPKDSLVLKKNVSANKLRNVQVQETALSDHDGSVRLFLRGGGATSLSPSHYGLRYDKSIIVNVRKLVGLADIPGSIDFLKIDAEGSELAILKGGKNLIERFSPIIGVEVHCQVRTEDGTCQCDVCKFLRESDYSLEIIGEMISPTQVHWVWAVPNTYHRP